MLTYLNTLRNKENKSLWEKAVYPFVVMGAIAALSLCALPLYLAKNGGPAALFGLPSKSEVDALRKRVQELEAAAAESPAVSADSPTK